MSGLVVAVSRSKTHSFSKEPQDSVRLLAGLGVEGDAHKGVTTQHRYWMRQDPNRPNLCQVHLFAAEMFDDLRDKGFDVGPGQIGENITTRGIDLLALPAGTRLHLGDEAVVEVTGLRTPCVLMDRFQPGLMAATRDHDADGNLIRKAGIMGVVVAGGIVRPDDPIRVALPPEPHVPLGPV